MPQLEDANVEFEQAGRRFRFQALSSARGDGEVATWRYVWLWDEDDHDWVLESTARRAPYEPAQQADEAVDGLLGFLEAFTGELGEADLEVLGQALTVVRSKLPRDRVAALDARLTDLRDHGYVTPPLDGPDAT